jgi:versiconal hemiacetal acetate esterase
LAEFPPTYLSACGADPLRDDNVVLEAELKSKGVKTRLDVYDGLPHLFWNFPTLKSSRIFVENLLAGIKFVLD